MHPLIDQGTSWTLRETGTDAETIRHNETLFALSNGHFGTRGSLEEAGKVQNFSYSEGTVMNGFYDTEPITYGEWSYGYATHHQTIIPLPNGKKLHFSLDGETFDLQTGTTTNHERVLDLKKGLLMRSFTWKNTEGSQVEVKMERFVSYDYSEIMAQKVTFTPLQTGSKLVVAAELDDLSQMEQQAEEAEDNDPRVKKQNERRFHSEQLETKEGFLLHLETKNSRLHTVVGAVSSFENEGAEFSSEDLAEQWELETTVNKPVVLERFTGYGNIYHQESETSQQAAHLENILQVVRKMGYEGLKVKHVETMNAFWDKSDIQIDGDDALQVGLRFNLFHLNQAAGRDGKTNMSAKGLTGEGYEGHYFWDTEMYMLPFFIYTHPKIAKQLLMYRHTILPQARERAREMAVGEGALFAWRTINGEEASPYYPAGTAQVHINGDIAHAVYTYIKATGDQTFAMNEGLEILVETARFWTAYGHYDEKRDNAFVINDVTGPDEYTAIVNNNFYTNLLAKHNLDYALEGVMQAIAKDHAEAKKMLDRIGFDEEELRDWAAASEAMFLPYDEEQKLTMQDDSFFHKKVWDLEATPKENFPLLLHYHPLTIYRHQVNKQADTVLGQFMFSWEFDVEQKKRDYDYYEAITTHDSSLSRSMFGMMASEIGDLKKAYNYFMDTALMDITDMQSNTKDGVHAANMGGTWMSLVYGFAGMRLHDNALHFSPKLPEQWNGLSFKVQYCDRTIAVNITQNDTDYTLLEGEPVTIYHNGKEKVLKIN